MSGAVTLPSYFNPVAVDRAANRRNQDRAEISREEFFAIMIAELKNQDPLDPLSNADLLGQISDMEQLSSATRAADGIEDLIESLKFQQLTIASTFIGTVVMARDDNGQEIQGLVGRVTISGGRTILGLQIPIVDADGNVVLDQDGNPLSREIPVDLASVVQVISPSLVDYTSTIVDPNARGGTPPGDEPADEGGESPGESQPSVGIADNSGNSNTAGGANG